MIRGTKWKWIVSALLAMGMSAAWSSQALPNAEPAQAGTQRIVFERHGVFQEPLLPIGPENLDEKESLLAAIGAYQQASDTVLTQPLEAWVAAHPDSPWAASLWLNMGLAHKHAGDYTEALRMLEQARLLGRAAHNIVELKIESRALMELLGLETHLGHTERVAALLKTPEALAGEGQVIGAVVRARADIAAMRDKPEESLRCGVAALSELFRQVKNDPHGLQMLNNAKAGKNGLTLTQVQKLAQSINFETRIIQRVGDAPIPVPSVVHWKVGHYATVLEEHDGRYLVRDTAQDGDIWVRSDVLTRQSSGYFLIPNKSAAPSDRGWLAVAKSKADHILGAGPTSASNSHEVGCDACKKKGMPSYSVATMLVSLQVGDIPVAYTPSKGPAVNLSLTYNELESDQPSSFMFSNVGPLWTHNWMSWVQDDPANVGTSVLVYLPGGGGRPYSGYDATTGQFAPEERTGATLVRIKDSSIPPVPYLMPVTNQSALDDSASIHYERRMSDGSVWVYASGGGRIYPRRYFLTQYIDPQGNTVTLKYDGDRLVSITDAAGLVTTLGYNLPANGFSHDIKYDYWFYLLTDWTDPYGRTAHLSYDDFYRLTGITDAEGMTSSFTYATTTSSASSNTNTAAGSGSGGGSSGGTAVSPDILSTTADIASMTTPYGTTTFSTNFDTTTPRNRWMVVTDPLGQTQRFEFNPNAAANIPYSESNVPSANPSLYNSWFNYRNTYYWDKNATALGYSSDYTKADITHWLHTSGNWGMVSGVVEGSKAPLEGRVWYTYPGQASGYGNGTGSLDKPSGSYRLLDDGTTQSTQKTYNSIGNLTSTIDPAGRETDYVYDTNQIDVLQVRQITGAGYDVIAAYTYNAQHLPLTYTDAAGNVTTYTYNPAGQLTTVTNPLGQTTTFVYDSLGFLKTEINPNGQVAYSYTYDSAGRTATKTDSEGYTLGFSYDNLDRLTQIQYPDATTDIYTYDKLDLATHTDRLGQITTYTYDSVRQLLQETDPAGNTINYGYYPGGQLHTLTDANGHLTQWDIDLQGRVTAKHFADGTLQTYTYENNTSRLHSASDALGQSRINTYAVDDRLKSVSYANAVNATPGASWAWDAYYPRLKSMTDSTGTTSYTYVPAGTAGALHLASEIGPVSNATIAYTYDPLGRVQTRTVDTSTESFGYDSLGRLASHTSPLGQFTNSYLGESGQVTQTTVENSPYKTVFSYLDNTDDRRLAGITHTAPSGSLVRSYQYQINALGQIKQRTTWSLNGSVQASSADANHDYTYDPAGNITNITIPDGSTDLTVNNANALLTYGTLNTVTDAAGNITDDGEHTYKWDAQNRLIEIGYKSVPGQKTNFRYDGLSRRTAIIETAATGATPVERHYLWCGEDICQERAQDETVTKHFYPEGELWLSGNKKIWYNRDSLGSVRDAQQLDTQAPWSDDTHSSSADYDAYGQGAGNGLSFQYAGMFMHQPSGLYLTHYRAYDPKRGRWLSRDPIEENGGVNLYAYVAGDPVNDTDELGLMGRGSGAGHGTPTQGKGGPVRPRTKADCINSCRNNRDSCQYGAVAAGTAAAIVTDGVALACTGGVLGAIGIACGRQAEECMDKCEQQKW